MKTIWKFPLKVTDRQQVEMPEGAHMLSVGAQDGTLMLWAVVDPERPKERVAIRIFGTGHPFTAEHSVFIGTVQLLARGMVWHVFLEMSEADLVRIQAAGREFDRALADCAPAAQAG